MGLIVIGAIVVAAAIISTFFGSDDWHVEAKNNSLSQPCLLTLGDGGKIYCPKIECLYEIECSAFEGDM